MSGGEKPPSAVWSAFTEIDDLLEKGFADEKGTLPDDLRQSMDSLQFCAPEVKTEVLARRVVPSLNRVTVLPKYEDRLTPAWRARMKAALGTVFAAAAPEK